MFHAIDMRHESLTRWALSFLIKSFTPANNQTAEFSWMETVYSINDWFERNKNKKWTKNENDLVSYTVLVQWNNIPINVTPF